jgi:uncharacterized protein
MQRRSLFAAAAALAAAPFVTRVAAANTDAPKEPGHHKVAIHVDANDPAVMNMVLNNMSNLATFYAARKEIYAVEVVAYGPGLHMLRDDTSPVKERIKTLAESNPSFVFSACHNTRASMAKQEDKEIPLLSQAQEVPAGIVRLVELQEQGWGYVKP